jgi:gliding motility-associated-like protein
MNTITKSVILSFTLCLLAFSSMAQMQYSRKYRVIAYKNGSPQTFSVSNEVEVIPPMTLYIPNTFTPNGDGMNDTFGIAGEAVKDFKMEVFNRWGQLIFESRDKSKGWDGNYLGKPQPIETYVWQMEGEDLSGKVYTKSGLISLIR